MPIRTIRFSRDAKRFVKHVGEQATGQAVALAREARRRIIVPHTGGGFGGHPIKTGRGIRSWNTSTGRPVATEPGIDAARKLKLGEAAYVATGVPYLHFVEFGTVRIAPRRWVRNALTGMGLHGTFGGAGDRDAGF